MKRKYRARVWITDDPGEKGVADRVPYRTDPEVINGVPVREELEHLPDSPQVLLRMVQPAHKRPHATPPGTERIAQAPLSPRDTLQVPFAR
jgi:hypothetical protein